MGIARHPYPADGVAHAQQGDTVDIICARYFGRTAGLTELVLDTNEGLAEFGPILPHGTPVILPALEDLVPAKPKTINLWD